eukprot:SM000022S07212  [mRNA]  locus=s22:493953:499216:- [translate_table: standard]
MAATPLAAATPSSRSGHSVCAMRDMSMAHQWPDLGPCHAWLYPRAWAQRGILLKQRYSCAWKRRTLQRGEADFEVQTPRIGGRRWRAQHFAKGGMANAGWSEDSLKEVTSATKLPSFESTREDRLFGVQHKAGDVVNGKYTISKLLGQGGVGTTYEAVNENNEKIALKAVSLRGMKGWKDLDLFKREAKVLRMLKHPGIPEYVDYFEADSMEDRTFYLAQRIAEGNSLADLMSRGWRVDEREVKRIALEVLEILRYLENLRPAVVHRDIKPDNIILDEATGKVKVVDFGAVQDVAATALIGSTVVGTYGYMAPEQFQNRAVPQSDLYALGGTLLFLLSGRPPSAFPQRRLKVDFRSSVSMSPGMVDVVERLMEPAPEDRYQSADEVIRELLNNDTRKISGPPSRNGSPKEQKRTGRPAGTKVVLAKTEDMIRISIPPGGLSSETALSGSFALAWNAFTAVWTTSAFAAGAPLLFTAFSAPFWVVGVGLARSTLSNLTVRTDITITKDIFSIEWAVGGGLWKHKIEGRAEDLNEVMVKLEGKSNGRPITACELVEGVRRHRFGGSLRPVEKDWIAQEIADFAGLPLPAPKADLEERMRQQQLLVPPRDRWEDSFSRRDDW